MKKRTIVKKYRRSPLLNFTETADIETSSNDYALRFSGEIGSWLLKVQEEATLQMLSPYA